MKLIALLLTGLLGTTAAIAQETNSTNTKPAPINHKNEIGLMGETDFGNSNNSSDISFGGLQYKRWVKPNMSYRIIAAYGEYFNASRPIMEGKFNDTIVEMNRQTNIPNAILGIGVEMQRLFYNRIYLYAAVEVRGNYGSGHYEYITTRRTEPEKNQPPAFYTTEFSGRASATMFGINANPSIGAKFQFTHFCFGTEISAVQMGFNSLSYSKDIPKTVNTLDFYAGSFRQRFFVSYRF